MDEVELFIKRLEEEHEQRMKALREKVEGAVVRLLAKERALAEAETARLDREIREVWSRRRRALEGRYALLYYREISNKKASLLAEILSRLEQEVSSRLLSRRETLMRSLVEEVAHLLPEAVAVQASPDDVELVRALLASKGFNLRVERASDLGVGVRVLLAGGSVLAENTLEGRMTRARERLACACGRVFGKAIRS